MNNHFHLDRDRNLSRVPPEAGGVSMSSFNFCKKGTKFSWNRIHSHVSHQDCNMVYSSSVQPEIVTNLLEMKFARCILDMCVLDWDWTGSSLLFLIYLLILLQKPKAKREKIRGAWRARTLNVFIIASQFHFLFSFQFFIIWMQCAFT